MTVYVLTAEGVHCAGVVGVYESEALARTAAEEIWPTTDGYHGFVIRAMTLNKTNPDAFPRQAYSRTQPRCPLALEVEDCT